MTALARIEVEVMEVTTTLRAGEGARILLAYRGSFKEYSAFGIPDSELLIEVDPKEADIFPLGRMFYLDIVPIEE